MDIPCYHSPTASNPISFTIKTPNKSPKLVPKKKSQPSYKANPQAATDYKPVSGEDLSEDLKKNSLKNPSTTQYQLNLDQQFKSKFTLSTVEEWDKEQEQQVQSAFAYPSTIKMWTFKATVRQESLDTDSD